MQLQCDDVMETNPTFVPRNDSVGHIAFIGRSEWDGLMYPMAQSEFVDHAPKQYELIRGR